MDNFDSKEVELTAIGLLYGNYYQCNCWKADFYLLRSVKVNEVQNNCIQMKERSGGFQSVKGPYFVWEQLEARSLKAITLHSIKLGRSRSKLVP